MLAIVRDVEQLTAIGAPIGISTPFVEIWYFAPVGGELSTYTSTWRLDSPEL